MKDCKILFLDEKTLTNLQYYMPSVSVLQQMANFFSVFSDETRLKILSALSITKMCVNDIANCLNLNQTTVSHQLRILKAIGAVKDERCDKIIYYSISDNTINEVMMYGVDYIFASNENNLRA